MKKFVLLTLLLLLSLCEINAQDIRFSWFQMQPLHLNPGLTGQFSGSVRVGGIYRDQGRVVSAAGRFATPSFFIDSPIIRGFGKNDWVGVGASFTMDGAGSSRLRTTISSLNLAYHLSLDRNRNNVLSIGAQMAGYSRKFSTDNFRFYDEFGPNGELEFNTTGENIQDFAFGDPIGMPTSYSSWTGGLVLTGKPNRDNSYQFGVTMAHINKPNQSVATLSRDSLSQRFTVFGSFTTRTSRRVKLTPTILFQKMSVNTEIVAQVMGQYRLNDEKDITLKGGVGFRFVGHPILYFGMQKGRLNVGLSYDVDMTTLRQANGTVGAFELGANYIINLYKKPNPDPVIFCPRF